MVKSSILLSKINRRKIIKNLGQFASIIIITLLAVCLAVGLNSSAQTLEKKRDLLLEGSNYADGIVYGLITDDEYNQISSLTDEVQKRLELESLYKDKVTKLLITDGVATINKPYTDNYNGGIYVNHSFATENELNIGDTFSVSISIKEFTEEYSHLIDVFDMTVKPGKTNIFKESEVSISFTIDGLMYHPESIRNDLSVSLDYDTFKNSLINTINENFTLHDSFIAELPLINEPIYSSILFKGDLQKVKDNFNKEDFFIFDTQYNPGLFHMNSDIDQAYQLTYVFPVIFIIVSILIIITTISQLIFKEKLNIATLKSIGISNREIYLHYMLLTISLCLIGGLIGALIGPVIIPNVMGTKYELLYSVPNASNVYSLFTISANILFFIIVSSIVSYFILRKSVNTLPAVLIRNKGNYKFKKSRLKIKSWSMKIALRNISQNTFRTLMVIVGVGGCASLFITGFGIDDTLANTVNKEIYHNFPYDANITFSDYSVDLKNKINKLDITHYEEYNVSQTTIDNEIFNLTNIYFIDNNTKIFNSGEFDGVYISSKVARDLNLSIEDDLVFTIDKVKYEYKINHIIDTGLTQGVFIPKGELELKVTNAWVKTDYQDRIDEVVTNYTGVKSVDTQNEFVIVVDEALGPISIIKITLQVFAFLLGVVVLYNLALLNYKERNRDIATLKVLGLTNKEISMSLMLEMMILAILGGIFGLIIGYPMLVLLLSINEVDFIYYIYNLSILSYALTFAFTTLTALVINMVLFKQIDKIKMVESLKSIE